MELGPESDAKLEERAGDQRGAVCAIPRRGESAAGDGQAGCLGGNGGCGIDGSVGVVVDT